MGVLLNSIKPCFNWKASLHFPIIWSKLKADAHSLIRSLISVPGNQNSLSLLCRDSFANCTQFQRFSKENLSMQSVNCHSVNNCLNIQTAQQLPIKKIKPWGLCKQTNPACLSWAGRRPGLPASPVPLETMPAGRPPHAAAARREDKEQQLPTSTRARGCSSISPLSEEKGRSRVINCVSRGLHCSAKNQLPKF